jgi:hypothetical protein
MSRSAVIIFASIGSGKGLSVRNAITLRIIGFPEKSSFSARNAVLGLPFEAVLYCRAANFHFGIGT